MQVLIADFDLFGAVGGGQTFYRAIIEKNPQVDFSYLIVDEAADAARPANARAVRYEEQYRDRDWLHDCDMVPPRWCMPAFLLASNIAWSVRGRTFDVVDVPDYQQLGYFLPAALEHHQAEGRRIALSMHGAISTTVSLNWGSDGQLPRTVVLQEEMQYQAADLRYGLSAAYLEEWQSRFALPSHYLSPLRFLDLPSPARSAPRESAPDLNFVGRTEKRKGPDLFAELVWWLPSDAYGQARMIGPPSFDAQGVSSERHLREMLRNRPGAKAIELCPSASRDELRRLFAGRGITVLPSRYDTFNLVAIESLFSGCPTAIGSGAGVCRFLDETFPETPYIKIDMDRPLSSLPELERALRNYDELRERLVESLETARPAATGPSLEEIYASSPTFDGEVRREAGAWYRRLTSFRRRPRSGLRRVKDSARRLVRDNTTPRFRAQIRLLRSRPLPAWKDAVERKLLATPLRKHVQSRRLQARAAAIAARYHAVAWMPERSAEELALKWRQCAQLIVDLRIDRTRLWREMARLESLRGNDLVAATYRLRAMRLCGEDRFQDLPWVRRTLEESGYGREAEVADAMYGGHADADRRCRELLDRTLDEHRRPVELPFELVDDRRERRDYRASVIVSLYNAANNLPRFLEAISLQTMLRAGQAELVLIDSGSPGDEGAVFRRWMESSGLHAVYARSANRETIQAAWNRGLDLARGRYVSFLGVDETILPQALETLAAELDAHPHIDWVQANSLVTRVNENGHWTGDVMTYDRAGYAQRLVYLETCYLSYVGAMYRRDIHQRLGYYDAAFGAAGDTEFKNRVLPFIKTKAIEQTLGVFWNYPAGQTTCSPRAEIEDLRAWHLHRTSAGIDYALQRSSRDEVESLLLAALQYRKSYCRHHSSDVEYAANVGRCLADAYPGAELNRLASGIGALLRAHRDLDCLPQISPPSVKQALAGAVAVARQAAQEHRQLTGGTLASAYELFHDNRHEQHQGVWPTEAGEQRQPSLPSSRRAA